MKLAYALTEEKRDDLPKKDFAVSASKSNTGERAYPIPDRQHARSALGFAKMHGDSADYARVRAKVEKKYPDMIDSKEASSSLTAFFDESVKLGTVTDEQARAALDRYETLERNKPSVGQVARYGALGAVSGPAIGAIGDVISGKPSGGIRGHLGRAFVGAMGSGAVPLLRAHLDRQAEKHTLKEYLHERGVDTAHRGPPTAGKISTPFEPVEKEAAKKKEKDAGTGITPARPFDAGAYTVDLVKGAFSTSEYSANLGPFSAPQKSHQPGFRAPNLRVLVENVPQEIKVSFKLQGHTEHQGIPIAIENRKGSVRKGVDKDGKPWRTKMKLPYGYIKGTKGADGEEVDCYVGPKKDATHAYVVHQKKENGKYDEDKVMLGQPSVEAARKAYLAHYNTDKFLGPIKSVPMERFKHLLESAKKLVKISAGAPTRGNFMMASEVPAFRPPQLRAAVQKQPQQIVTKLGAAVTPTGMLTAAKRVGLPRVTAPSGPSIAQVAKPVGFGKPAAGALKNKI